MCWARCIPMHGKNGATKRVREWDAQYFPAGHPQKPIRALKRASKSVGELSVEGYPNNLVRSRSKYDDTNNLWMSGIECP